MLLIQVSGVLLGHKSKPSAIFNLIHLLLETSSHEILNEDFQNTVYGKQVWNFPNLYWSQFCK